ncbi:MAG TPA: DUF6199 family natural product biosynthesis protein [Actinocatenispora sp.]
MFLVVMLLLVLVIAGGLVVSVVAPRRVWWATVAWRYADPAANEPSDAAFTATRVVSVLALGIVAVVAISFVWNDYTAGREDADRSRHYYQQCLADHRPLTETPFVPLAPGQTAPPTVATPSEAPPEEQCAELSPTPG